MIVLDTARPEYTSAYGHPRPTTPFLETFAEQGTRFERAYSSSCWTLPAHVALFTGAPSSAHGVDQLTTVLRDDVPVLAEQLAETGYQTAAFTGNQWITEKTGLARGFQHFKNCATGAYGAWIRALAADRQARAIRPAEHYVVGWVLDWIENTLRSDEPFFLFVNLVDPHTPYLPDGPSARPFFDSPKDRWQTIQRIFPGSRQDILIEHVAGRHKIGEAEQRELSRLYEGALRLTDSLTRAIIRAVDRAVEPADTLIFILSDHGENLGDHDLYAHSFNLYDSNLRIVLMARGPGFSAGSMDPRPVHITDVYATILAAAGLVVPAASEAVDLRGEIPRDRVLTASLSYPKISIESLRNRVPDERFDPFRVELAAAIADGFKLLRRSDVSGQIVTEVLYDLSGDPDELHPLRADEVDTQLLERLRASLPRPRRVVLNDATSTEQLSMDAEQLEALRALGYVGDDD